MKKLVLLFTLTFTALSAQAQIGATYNQLVGHFGRGTWSPGETAWKFSNGFYSITASFGTGHQKYCDLLLYSHRDGSDFTKAEIAKLARRSYSGTWYAVRPSDQSANGPIALWGVKLRGSDFYIMLYNTTLYRDSNNAPVPAQAVMIGASWAFQARGYWYDPNNRDDGNTLVDGNDNGDTY